MTYVQVGSIVLWAVVLPGGSCDSSRNTIIVYVYERFRWGLTSGERYSTGRLIPQKRRILCACQHFVSERVGVLAEYGGVVVRLPLGLRSLTLLRCLSRHSSLVLCSCLTLQAMAPKAYLTGKSKDKVAAKKTRKKPGGPRFRRCWAELHGWSHAVLLLGLDTCAKPSFA